MDTSIHHESGRCLDGEYYGTPAAFESDYRSIISRQWHFAGMRSQCAKTGDRFILEICGESIVVVLNNDSQVRAFFNVCKHRGSRLVDTPSKSNKSIICPYHGWQYDLDGNLRNAKCMPPGFDCDQHRLTSLPVIEYEGLLFIALTEDAPPLGPALDKLEQVLPFHRLNETKIALRKDYQIRANWKLVIENFLECYHCMQNHPEFSSVYSHIQASAQCESVVQSAWYEEYAHWSQQALERQYPIGSLEFFDPTEEVPCVAYRSHIKTGFLTTSKTGQPLAPLLGNFTTYDGGELFGFVGPFFHFSVANDHAILFRFLPSDETTTNATIFWLVRNDAEENRDYNVEDLAWVWEKTFEQDQEIVERTQKNMTSRYFKPGPYSLLEGQSSNFIEWYLFNLKRTSK